jgi:hypothetical protein
MASALALAEKGTASELALVVVTGKHCGRGSGYTGFLRLTCNMKCRRSRCTSTGVSAGTWYTLEEQVSVELALKAHMSGISCTYRSTKSHLRC